MVGKDVRTKKDYSSGVSEAVFNGNAVSSSILAGDERSIERPCDRPGVCGSTKLYRDLGSYMASLKFVRATSL